MESVSSRIAGDGFTIANGVFEDEVPGLVAGLNQLPQTQLVRRRGEVYGVRDLFAVMPDLVDIVRSEKMRGLVEPILGSGAFAVRSIYFDKPAAANWMVPWHQDLTIATREKADVTGFGPWSVKAGIDHVQPPAELLAHMLTVRVHLDDCDETNGALEVISASHTLGRLSSEDIAALRKKSEPTVCRVRRGGCVLMRPLLLHASKPAANPNHRRVIHIEFAADNLPSPLEWYERVG